MAEVLGVGWFLYPVGALFSAKIATMPCNRRPTLSDTKGVQEMSACILPTIIANAKAGAKLEMKPSSVDMRKSSEAGVGEGAGAWKSPEVDNG